MKKEMKVLVVDDEPGVRELLCALVEGSFEYANTIQADSGESAIAVLSSDKDIDIIISDFDMPKGDGSVVFQYAKKESPHTPFLFFTSHTSKHVLSLISGEPYAIISKTSGFEEVCNSVQKILEEKAIITHPRENYCKFRPAMLLKMGILPSDAFVKINEDKYVRIMYKGDTFEAEDFEHYNSKKLTYLYLKRDDFHQLIVRMEKDLQRLNKLLNEFQEDVIDIPASAHSLVREFYHNFGINETMQRVVKETVELTMRSIRAQPALRDLFKKVKQKEDQYLSYHSILLAHLTCILANKMEWTSTGTVNKLVMASFLHDVALPDYDIQQVISLEKEIHEKRTEIFRHPHLMKHYEHPQDAAELFNKIEQPIPDVSIILAQHHERPDGEGFPHHLTALTISPLAAILITAHEVVDAYFLANKNLDFPAFINSLSPAFHKGNFKAVTRVLTDLAINL